MNIKTTERAAELLRVAARFIDKHDLESLMIAYDGVDCDGECLKQDMLNTAEDLLPAGAGR